MKIRNIELGIQEWKWRASKIHTTCECVIYSIGSFYFTKLSKDHVSYIEGDVRAGWRMDDKTTARLKELGETENV